MIKNIVDITKRTISYVDTGNKKMQRIKTIIAIGKIDNNVSVMLNLANFFIHP